ncbi:MAG: hypothetical protein ABW318_09990 [Vicinamibacterales bacterium]
MLQLLDPVILLVKQGCSLADLVSGEAALATAPNASLPANLAPAENKTTTEPKRRPSKRSVSRRQFSKFGPRNCGPICFWADTNTALAVFVVYDRRLNFGCVARGVPVESASEAIAPYRAGAGSFRPGF